MEKCYRADGISCCQSPSNWPDNPHTHTHTHRDPRGDDSLDHQQAGRVLLGALDMSKGSPSHYQEPGPCFMTRGRTNYASSTSINRQEIKQIEIRPTFLRLFFGGENGVPLVIHPLSKCVQNGTRYVARSRPKILSRFL